MTKPRSLSHILKRSGLVFTPDDTEIAIWISRLQSQFRQIDYTQNERAAYPHASAQRHTARPPTARDSTPEGGVHIHRTDTMASSAPLTYRGTADTHRRVPNRRHSQTSQQTANRQQTASDRQTDALLLLRTTATEQRPWFAEANMPQTEQSFSNQTINQYYIRAFETFNQHSIHHSISQTNRADDQSNRHTQSGTTGGRGARG